MGQLALLEKKGLGEFIEACSPLYVGLLSPLAPDYRLLIPHDEMTQAMRQGANSAVRLTTYSTLKSFVSGNSRPGEVLPAGVTFGIGAIAGVVTVYATMPLDVIKTRMQSLEAKTQYRNSFHCAARIFSEEGVFKFWRGATPRLARLVLSGGIVFTVYERG